MATNKLVSVPKKIGTTTNTTTNNKTNLSFLDKSKFNEFIEKGRAEEKYQENIENDPYMNMYNQQSSMLSSQANAQKAYQQQLLNQSEANINTGYNKNANTAYINYRQNQKDLPEQLSNLGATGGASESAALKAQNAYAQNLQQNEAARNSDLASARNSYSANINDIDSSLNAGLADAYQYYGGLSTQYQLDQKSAYEDAVKRAEVDGWNERVQYNIAKREGEGWDVITWEDSDGKLHYVKDAGATYLNNQSKKTAQAIAEANNRTLQQAKSLADQGYTVKTTYVDGVAHNTVTGKKN